MSNLGRAPIDADQEVSAVVLVPALLTIGTVARLLDCHPRTVRRRIDDGSLKAVNEHDRTMVRGDDLREYIEGLARVGTRAPRRPRQRAAAGRFDFLRQ